MAVSINWGSLLRMSLAPDCWKLLNHRHNDKCHTVVISSRVSWQQLTKSYSPWPGAIICKLSDDSTGSGVFAPQLLIKCLPASAPSAGSLRVRSLRNRAIFGHSQLPEERQQPNGVCDEPSIQIWSLADCLKAILQRAPSNLRAARSPGTETTEMEPQLRGC